MKKNFLSIFIVLFVLIFTISFIFLPKKSFSENENRYLEKFPTFSYKALLNGKYISSLENYIIDHFPLRDLFMSIKSNTELLLGERLINNVYVGKNEYLFMKYDKMENPDRLIKKLNDFYNNNDINMQLMLVESSGNIYSELLPKNVDYSIVLNDINYICNNIEFDCIDIHNYLMDGKKNYNMFYKLDHHWTSYGAYYAYLAFASKNNITPISINDFDIKEISNSFNGTLYSKTGLYQYKSDSIVSFNNNSKLKVNYVNENVVSDTLYNIENLDKKDKYTYFLNGNHPLIEITNEELSDNILVIKDSYANSFIPFLTNHYGKVYVIDLRFYSGNISNFISENNIENVLFLYSMQGISEDVNIYKLK